MLEMWHERFAHLNYFTLKKMKSHNSVFGLTDDFSNIDLIEKCIFRKMCTLSFKTANENRGQTTLQLVHTDLACLCKPNR